MFKSRDRSKFSYIAEPVLLKASFVSEKDTPAFEVAPIEDIDKVATDLTTLISELSNRAPKTELKTKRNALLTKLESVAPDLLFDIEKKIGLTLLWNDLIIDFSEHYTHASEAFDRAQANGNRAGAERAAERMTKLMIALIAAMQTVYEDYKGFLDRKAYDHNLDKLSKLKVDERRRIDSFYSRFDAMRSRLNRLFERDIPAALRRNDITLDDLVNWVSRIYSNHDDMMDACLMLLDIRD